MSTIRDQLNADLQAAEAKVAEIKIRISAMEQEGMGLIDREVIEVKAFFRRVRDHLPFLGLSIADDVEGQ